MSRKTDYPRASMAKSLELAGAVYQLGGSCTIDMCAEQMGKSVGGGFRDTVGSAVKYGFISNNKGNLKTTSLFTDYELGYSDVEKTESLKSAFLNVPLFNEIVARFSGRPLPVEILNKLLVREFHVNQQVASRVAKHFIDAAKAVGLLSSDNNICSNNLGSEKNSDRSEVFEEPVDEDEFEEAEEVQESISKSREYSVMVSGPGMNHKIVIGDVDDLEIVNAILRKVMKKVSENGGDSNREE